MAVSDYGAQPKWPWKEHWIQITSVTHAQFEGISVMPIAHLAKEEIDRFCLAGERALAKTQTIVA